MPVHHFIDRDMPEPARWRDDPPCGHQVAWAHQTHYCTYIRVPRLLTLQRPRTGHPDEILGLLALQAFELWFKVLLTDLEATLQTPSDQLDRFEPVKLLRRASRLVRLLDRQLDVSESILIHDLSLRLPLGPDPERASRQLEAIQARAEALEAWLAGPPGTRPSLRSTGRDFLGRFQVWAPQYRAFLARLADPAGDAGPGYDDLLALEDLLSLQNGVKGDWAPEGQPPARLVETEDLSPDELMFIVVHQAFELWFRAILHELDTLLPLLQAEPPDIDQAIHRLRRVVRIQKFLVEQIHIPATMTAMDFLRFRQERRVVDGVVQVRGLSPASGTESYQFREIEILGGLKNSVSFVEFLEGHPRLHIRFLTPRQQERLAQPSLPELFEDLLRRRGIDDPVEIFRPAVEPNPHADLAELADLLLEFDEFFQLWRVHHLTMVQSMIGRKSGTGFLGPEYLRETLGMGMQREDDRIFPTPQVRPRFFEALWEVRTRLRLDEDHTP